MKLSNISSLPRTNMNRGWLSTVAMVAGTFAVGLSPIHAAPDGSGATADTNDDDNNWYDPGGWFNRSGEGGVDRPQSTGNTPSRNRVNRDADTDSREQGAAAGGGRGQDPATGNGSGAARDRGDGMDGGRADAATDRENSSIGATRTWTGIIEGFQRVHVETDNEPKQHSFVRLKLTDGESKVVALGTRLNLADLDLKKGDYVTITGKEARVDDRDVVVATRLMVEDELYRVRPQERIDEEELKPAQTAGTGDRRLSDSNTAGGQLRNSQGSGTDGSNTDLADRATPGSDTGNTGIRTNQGQEGSRVIISGTLDDHRRVRLTGRNQESLIIRLELEDGKACVADLGVNTSLERLGLEDGAEIELEGRRTIIDGRQLVIAEMLRAEGKATRLQQVPQSGDADDNDDGTRIPGGTLQPTSANP